MKAKANRTPHAKANGKAKANGSKEANGKKTMADWTIMVYVAADEGLANFAIETLKQLRDTANGNVLVAAQFDADGSAETQEVCRFIFDGSRKGQPLNQIKESPSLPADINMTDPGCLTAFIEWARRECKANHYCLILWGHGPELLFEGPVKTVNGGDKRLYLTPVQLKKGLMDAGFGKKNKLHIIGMDACSMSLIEYAHELKDLAMFVVASQEEVPDLSFPYDRLTTQFGKHSDPEELCKAGLDDYAQTYQDYICTPWTGMRKVTLSCLSLEQIGRVATGIKKLVAALEEVANVKNGGSLILEARRAAKGFVGGIFVDLVSFCWQMKGALGPNKTANEKFDNLRDACDEVCKAVEVGKDKLVMANKAADERCHGLSIYFPYLKEDEMSDIEGLSLIKGPGGSQQDTGKGPGGSQQDTGKGPGGSQQDTGKGPGGSQQDTGKSVAIANMAARNIQYAVRRALIADTEGYYVDEYFDFQDTGWYDFIARDWCRILVDNEPENLDRRYSAQQVAQNLLRGAGKRKAAAVNAAKAAAASA